MDLFHGTEASLLSVSLSHSHPKECCRYVMIRVKKKSKKKPCRGGGEGKKREKNKIKKCHDRGSVGWGGCWVGLDLAVWSLFLGNWGGIGKGLIE